MLIAVAPVAAILVFLHATAAANMSLIVLACLGTQIIDNFLVLLQGRSPDQNRATAPPRLPATAAAGATLTAHPTPATTAAAAASAAVAAAAAVVRPYASLWLM